MESGISTLGVKLSYGVETTAGTKPTAFDVLHRINQIAGISLDTEQIDASALEDLVSRYIAGRQDTGGTFPVTVNYTDDTLAEWEDVIDDYADLSGGKRMWFQVSSPYLTKAFFIIAQPPLVMPMPEMGQNSLMTVDMTLVIEEYKGADTAVTPTDSDAS